MDPLSLATTLGNALRTLYSVGDSLYLFIRDAKKVDKSLEDLAREARGLTRSLEDIETLLEDSVIAQTSYVTSRPDGVWRGIRDAIQETRDTVAALQQIVRKLGPPSNITNGFRRTTKQLQLNLNMTEIDGLKSQIHMHAITLQMSLHTATLVISCQTNDNVINELNPKIDTILPIVPKLESLMQEMEKLITSKACTAQRSLPTTFKNPSILDHVRQSRCNAEKIIAAASALDEPPSATRNGRQGQALSFSKARKSAVRNPQNRDIVKEWIKQITIGGECEKPHTKISRASDSNIGCRKHNASRSRHKRSDTWRLSEAGKRPMRMRATSRQHLSAESCLGPNNSSRHMDTKHCSDDAGDAPQHSRSGVEFLKRIGIRGDLTANEALLILPRAVYTIPTKRHEADVIAALLVLLDRGANVDTVDEAGDSVLHIAAMRGHTCMVELLCVRGVNIMAKSHSGFAALHVAAMQAHENDSVISLLLSYGAHIDQRTDHDGLTPLDLAVKEGRISTVACLLAAGASVNVRDWEGHTPLHRAADEGRENEAVMLLDAGALVEARCRDGDTALHYACMRGQIITAEILLQAGAYVDARGDFEATPLHVAQVSRSRSMTRLLVDQGAPINARDATDQTPLMLAVEYGKTEIVRFLLASGADLEARNQDGETAMFYVLHENTCCKTVAFDDQLAVFALLCEKDADLNAMDNTGTSIIDVIMDELKSDRRRKAFRRILRHYGIRITTLENSDTSDTDELPCYFH